jgi:hypothetical protein
MTRNTHRTRGKVIFRFCIFFLAFAIFLLVLPAVFSVLSYLRYDVEIVDPGGITYNYKRCCFHEYTYDENYIYYRCSVGLINHSDQGKMISLSGLYLIDPLIGYLSSPIVTAIDEEGDRLEIILAPREEIHFDNIIFRGEKQLANKFPLKFDRSMPLLFLTNVSNISYDEQWSSPSNDDIQPPFTPLQPLR